MTLDKQRILSELGNVMNQLQSADCGCMGKLFAKPEHDNSMSCQPTCGGGYNHCCHRGYSGGGGMGGFGMGGDMGGGNMGGGNMGAGNMGMSGNTGYTDMGGNTAAYNMAADNGGNMNTPMRSGDMNMGAGGMGGRSMGRGGGGMGLGGAPNVCDKFAMLDSLKHTPALYNQTYNYLKENLMKPTVNEVYNDLKSLNASNSVPNNPLSSQIPGISGGGSIPTGTNEAMVAGPTGNAAPMTNNNPLSNDGLKGMMGSQIVNMMTGGRAPAGGVVKNNGDLGGGNMLIDAPQSPHGQIGLSASSYDPTMGSPGKNPHQGNPQFSNPTTQYVTQENSYPSGGNANAQRENMMPGNARPAAGMPSGMSPATKPFQNLFPSDLGFDPMAIAIQMNPANQQKVAMSNMERLMNGKPVMGATKPGSQPAEVTGQAPSGYQGQQQPGQYAQQPSGQYTQQPSSGQYAQQPSGQYAQQQQPGQYAQNQQIYAAHTEPPPTQEGQPPQYAQPQTQQNAQHAQQYLQAQPQQGQAAFQQGQYTQQQENRIDPNSGHQYATDANQPVTETLLQPVFPVNTGNIKYNTLGQPVAPEPAPPVYYAQSYSGPQTLSPQGADAEMVKNTVSRTALAPSRGFGNSPSKSELRHLYRYYKAANLTVPTNVIKPSAPYGGSQSDGKLNRPSGGNIVPIKEVPMETRGGDTVPSNIQQEAGQTGDVKQINQPHGDVDQNPQKIPGTQSVPVPVAYSKSRNGLQDKLFTKYTGGSKGWSFHGVYHPSRPMPARGDMYRHMSQNLGVKT